jgi:hypothetical protein
MPESDGGLTDADQKVVSAWLEKHWTGSARNCPVCGSLRWDVGKFLAHVPAGAGVFAGKTYPLISLASNPCGYTLFFNAIIVGVVKPESPKPNPESSQSSPSGEAGS